MLRTALVAVAIFSLISVGLAQDLTVDEKASRLELLPQSEPKLSLQLYNHTSVDQSANSALKFIAPDGTVRATVRTRTVLHPGRNVVAIAIPVKPEQLPPAEQNQLLWFRLHYQVESGKSGPVTGVLSVSQITPQLFEIKIAGLLASLPGSIYSARVRAEHPLTKAPQAGVSLQGELLSGRESAAPIKASAVTNRQGEATLSFSVPADFRPTMMDGALKVSGLRGGIAREATLDLRNNLPDWALISTDKPIYQPGQVLHMRGLLRSMARKPLPNQAVTLKITDPDDILVYREELKTSRFGIAHADWTIPDNQRLGDYRIRMIPGTVDDDDNGSDIRVKISRYDLPQFVVTAKPDRAYYLPGQNAKVKLRADYLFGKPLPRGHVRLVREEARYWNYHDQKYESDESEKWEGELAGGEVEVPVDLTEKHKRLVEDNYSRFRDYSYAAYITDPSTGRTEPRRFDLRVSREAIHVYVIAQEAVYPGFSSQFYISTQYPDGTPVSAGVTIGRGPRKDWSERVPLEEVLRTVRTDQNGLARVDHLSIPVSNPYTDTLVIEAKDSKGRTGRDTEGISTSDGRAIRVTTNKALYRDGESIAAAVESNRAGLRLIAAAVHGREVVWSEPINLLGKRGYFTVPYHSKFKDEVTLVVYNFDDSDSQGWRGPKSARTVLFPHEHGLKLGLQLDRAVYRPGDDAEAAFRVKRVDGHGAESALGIIVSDKAVEARARTEEDFGRGHRQDSWGYWGDPTSIGGHTRADLDVIDWSKPVTEEQDLVAEVLLAAAGNESDSLPGFEDSREYDHDLGALFRKELLHDVEPATLALAHRHDRGDEYPSDPRQLFTTLQQEGVSWASLRDPWDHPFTPRFETEKQWEIIRAHSVGPDGLPDTDDDCDTEVTRWRYFQATGEKIDAALKQYHQRTGLYITDPKVYFAELRRAGTDVEAMHDRWGNQLVPQISVEGRYDLLQLVSPGPNHRLDGNQYWTDDFPIWETRVDYFVEEELKMQDWLNEYWRRSGTLPKGDADAREALKSLPPLKDFWGNDLYFESRDYSYYADHVETVASTNASGGTEQHTVVTPVSTKVWVVDVFSRGLDGIRGNQDDFRIGAVLKIISEQSASQAAPTLTASPVVVAMRGNLAGVVVDSSGAVVAGSRVTISGPSGTKSDVTNQDGQFLFPLLVPGLYNVKVEKASFKSADIKSVEVVSERTSNIRVGLVAGQATEVVEVSASAITVNTTSTAVANNLADKSFYQSVPIGKGATGLFYAHPGVTGGFEGQYGKSTGGLVQIVTKSGGGQPPVSTPRLREYFPETLLWAPEVVTDKRGHVRIRFKVADNITTWNVSVLASTVDGQIGTVTKSFRAFQPFFAELDPPKTLTLNDEIALPVIVRNFLPQPQSVTMEMAPADWFQLSGSNPQTIPVAANEAQNAVFPFRAIRFVRDGHQRVTASGTDAADAVERTVYVHPDGEERSATQGGLLAADKTLTITLPNETFPATQRTEIKIYPNLLAHVTEGIEGILERPHGCGEQTISSTFPSLLLLKAEKQLGQHSEYDAVARRYLQFGYNRLLSYRDSSGGFTYWGYGDPDIALTAYALRFLREAGAFIPVDESAIADAQAWLVSKQSKQGEWHENDVLSAYVERILAGAPNQDKTLSGAIEAAMTHLAERAKQDDDPYFIASYALAAQANGKQAEADGAVRRLRTLMHAQGEEGFWELQRNTPFYGWGHTGKIESTALAVRAIFNSDRKAGAQDPAVARGLQFLLHEKDRYGVWYSGQTTINVLDTLVEMLAPPSGGENAAVHVRVNGEEAGSIAMPAGAKASAPMTLDISSRVKPGENRIELTRASGEISSVQVVSTFYVPWTSSPAMAVSNQRESDTDRLRLAVHYDKTEAKIAEMITAHVEVERIGHRGYGMLLAEIGLPPGADVDRASLDKAVVDYGWGIDHYDLLPDRLVVYLWPSGGPTVFNFSFRERYGIHAKTAPSSVYDYYNPDVRAIVQPTIFAVQ